MSSKFYTGDSLDVLRTLPDCSVQCVVTSPPYWGLRDYGVAGQLGLEPTPDEYLAKMIEIFREVRRVLRDDGTCWVNIGDAYAQTGGKRRADEDLDYYKQKEQEYISDGRGKCIPSSWDARGDRAANTVVSGLKPKDLIGMPWRLAFALQADGWYLRSDIIWHKPNPMPESVRDRPTKAHEYIFLLTKSNRYFWDNEGVREKSTQSRPDRKMVWSKQAYKNNDLCVHHQNNGSKRKVCLDADRNIRTVWTIPSKPFKESHFATFPPVLVERCVKAGTSEWGCCPSCGKTWVRKIQRKSRPNAPCCNGKYDGIEKHRTFSGGVTNDARTYRDFGFCPACICVSAEPIPCTVLDPFSGAGTVALVCERLGRDSIGIELNPKYVAIAERRLDRNRQRRIDRNGKEIHDLQGQSHFAWAIDAI